MRSYTVLFLLSSFGATACTHSSDERHFTLQGQVLNIAPDHREATIKHEEIKGLMPAMTMPYKVKDATLLNGLAPGDLITARLVVVPNDAYLVAVTKVGTAPLEASPTDAPVTTPTIDLLKPGDSVPNATFVDQDGRKRAFDSLKGRTVVLTFIYTRCPMPTFCPLMDRNFASIQRKLKAEEPEAERRVHLVSISFDPATDTPPVLKKHAKTLEADPKIWTFLTGDRDEIDQFASRFGVTVARAAYDERDITHNLRTAIIDPSGKVVKIYSGNEWTPDDVLGVIGKASS
jgi:protein SCO1/2